MQLRDYQELAVHNTYEFLQTREGHPLIVIPTGGGKTPVIAQLCHDAVTLWNGRVLVLAHVKELLEQSASTLRAVCPTLPVGVYSAGLGRREMGRPVTVAGIQSVYARGHELGRVDLVIVDEAHLIPPDDDSMYRTLLDTLEQLNPDLRVIGLTATPYRLSGGLIYGDGQLFEERAVEVGVSELVNRGYLCPLVGKAADGEVQCGALRIVRGEFDERQAEAMFTDVVISAVNEVVTRTVDRRSVLLFCQTVDHARWVAARLRADLIGREVEAAAETRPAWELFGLDPADPLADHRLCPVYDWLLENGHPVDRLTEWMRRGRAVVGEVYGDTPAGDRADMITRFRGGDLRYLVNVNVLTTGFDAPNVDCVCLLRATVSPGLYYQMVGRGFRLHPDKKNCLVLDFGQNIQRHGPVDDVKPAGKKSADGEAVAKVCPQCRTVVAGGVSVCPDCGHIWPAREFEPTHAGTAEYDDPLSTSRPKKETLEVFGVDYAAHTKKNAPPGHPKTLRVRYRIGVGQYVSEWVCVEHPEGSFARSKAEQWWRKRCRFPMPNGIGECVSVANHGLLADPVAVTLKTKPGEKYPDIASVDLGDKPDHPAPCPECGAVNQSVIVPTNSRYHAGAVVCGICNTHLWDAQQEVVDRYGYYTDHQQVGLLPDGWKFEDEDTAAEGQSLFQQIESLGSDLTAGATEEDEVPF